MCSVPHPSLPPTPCRGGEAEGEGQREPGRSENRSRERWQGRQLMRAKVTEGGKEKVECSRKEKQGCGMRGVGRETEREGMTKG